VASPLVKHFSDAPHQTFTLNKNIADKIFAILFCSMIQNKQNNHLISQKTTNTALLHMLIIHNEPLLTYKPMHILLLHVRLHINFSLSVTVNNLNSNTYSTVQKINMAKNALWCLCMGKS